MPAFNYSAINTQGKEQKGVLEAENEKHARQLLRDKTLVPLQIRSVASRGKIIHSSSRPHDLIAGSNKFFKPRNKLGSKDLALVTRQFATLLAAGLPIEESLVAVSEQSEKPYMKGLLISVRSKVTEGHSLATALKEHPEAFSNLYTATVAAGEKTGHLDKVLLRLADYTEQQAHMRQKLKTALIYPAMIVLVACGIVGFLLEYVVPKMVAVYGHMNQALPFLTVLLIGISNFVKSYGLYFLIFLILGIFSFNRAIKKNKALRERYHRHLLKLPLIGYALKSANTARFSRTLSILTAAGVPVLEAMNIAANLITVIPINKAVIEAISKVREGAAIHLALKNTTYFSPMSVHMIASGEASGELENMLSRVAHNQEDEISRLVEVALALFEPAIILIMGAVVLFIVLAVLLPIFQLNQFTG